MAGPSPFVHPPTEEGTDYNAPVTGLYSLLHAAFLGGYVAWHQCNPNQTTPLLCASFTLTGRGCMRSLTRVQQIAAVEFVRCRERARSSPA